MPLNLIKKYPQLLDIIHLSEQERDLSLRRIFDRDIQDNEHFYFNENQIHPLKDVDGISSLNTLFSHLTKEATKSRDENGKEISCRNVFEPFRSQRLHWIKHHIDGCVNDGIKIFSRIERDLKKRQDITKTYIYNEPQKYVIILECQRSNTHYYLLSAYYLNKDFGEKEMKKKMKNVLPDII